MPILKTSLLSRRLVLITLPICLLVVGGCSFRAPSVAEQRVLLEKGAFPSGVPAWMSRPATRGYEVRRQSVGSVPEVFSGMPNSASATAESSAAGETLTEAEKSLAEPDKKKEEEETVAGSEEKEGPLHRIEFLCPGLEQQVIEAITTVNKKMRLSRMQALSRKCPTSSDIWAWVGVEYLNSGRQKDAEYSLRQAQALDVSNEEAMKLEKQLAEAASKKKK